jgi:hypothetical protein
LARRRFESGRKVMRNDVDGLIFGEELFELNQVPPKKSMDGCPN